MRWDQGRATLDGMLSQGEIKKIAANRAHADELLDQSRRHLDTARLAMEPIFEESRTRVADAAADPRETLGEFAAAGDGRVGGARSPDPTLIGRPAPAVWRPWKPR